MPPPAPSLSTAGIVLARRLADRPHDGLAAVQLRMEEAQRPPAASCGDPTYHAGKQFPIIVTGHPSGAVELEPAILARPHAQQARVDLWAEGRRAVSSKQAQVQRKREWRRQARQSGRTRTSFSPTANGLLLSSTDLRGSPAMCPQFLRIATRPT